MVNNWRPQDIKSKEWMKDYDLTRRQKDPVGALVRGAKKRASMKELEFNLDSKDLLPYPEVCPVLGMELVYGRAGWKQHDSPSIDRFDNTKGYTKQNCHIISSRANELKRDGSLEEFEKIITYMKDIIN